MELDAVLTALQADGRLVHLEHLPARPPIDGGVILINLGAVKRLTGDTAGAKADLERALEIIETTSGASHPTVDVLHADAGWSAVLRVAATAGEEEITLDLLERDAVIVYPGFFFDFPREAFLIVSLLPEPRTFTAGVQAVLGRVDG